MEIQRDDSQGTITEQSELVQISELKSHEIYRPGVLTLLLSNVQSIWLD